MDATIIKDQTMKLGGNVTWLSGYPERSSGKVETVWEEEKTVDLSSHTGKLQSLTKKVELMARVFEQETMARAQQRQLMDELHEDQMKRLDEISDELENSMAELAKNLEAFTEKFRNQLGHTFDELYGELQGYVNEAAPRLARLEERGQQLKAGIDEERTARIRENTQIVLPLKEQIVKLQTTLDHEKAVREARDSELTRRMEEAISALEAGLEAETQARSERLTATFQDWRHEIDRLQRRQDSVALASKMCFETTADDMSKESNARLNVQDPVVQALTRFIQEFHADVKEKAEMG